MLLKRNIIANFAGQGWTILIGLLVVPFYVRLMGIEGYGLVGFYLTLQAVFNSFLDFGLSVTITREIARYSVSPDKINRTRDLVRTLEIGYWLIGLLLGLTVILGAPFIANNWLRAENISPDSIRQIVMAMGIATIFQWPLTFYQGGLVRSPENSRLECYFHWLYHIEKRWSCYIALVVFSFSHDFFSMANYFSFCCK